MTTPRYHHGDLRRALLAGARALLRESGADELSLREVARRAGVSHAAPYHHFSSREELLAAVAAEAFEEMDRAMAEAQAAAPESPEAQLVAVGMGYFLFALREPAVFRIMMRPEYGGNPPSSRLEDAPEERRSGTPVQPATGVPRPANQIRPDTGGGPYARLASVLGDVLGAPADPVSIDLCWSAVHGLACLALEGALEVPRESVAAHARSVLGRLALGLSAKSTGASAARGSRLPSRRDPR